MSRIEKTFLLLLLSMPSVVIASDYTGFFALMYLIIVVSITSSINIGLIISFYFSGKYSDKKFASKHAFIFSAIPLAGCLLSLFDHRNAQDLLFSLGLNVLAFIVGLLPILLARVAGKVEHLSPRTVFGISACCLVLSYFLRPLAAAAIITAHASLKKTTGSLRKFNFVLLAGGYVSLLFWLAAIGKVF